MRRRTLGLLGSFSLLGLAMGCASPTRDAVYLDVFDCLIPIPPGYAVNTSDSSTTHAYFAADRAEGFGSLIVSTADHPVARDRFEILESETRGRLEIQKMGVPAEAGSPQTLILISDGKRRLALTGDAALLADSMIEACFANPR